MKISLQAQDLVFELLSDKVTDLLDSSLMFIEVGYYVTQCSAVLGSVV